MGRQNGFLAFGVMSTGITWTNILTTQDEALVHSRLAGVNLFRLFDILGIRSTEERIEEAMRALPDGWRLTAVTGP